MLALTFLLIIEEEDRFERETKSRESWDGHGLGLGFIHGLSHGHDRGHAPHHRGGHLRPEEKENSPGSVERPAGSGRRRTSPLR